MPRRRPSPALTGNQPPAKRNRLQRMDGYETFRQSLVFPLQLRQSPCHTSYVCNSSAPMGQNILAQSNTMVFQSAKDSAPARREAPPQALSSCVLCPHPDPRPHRRSPPPQIQRHLKPVKGFKFTPLTHESSGSHPVQPETINTASDVWLAGPVAREPMKRRSESSNRSHKSRPWSLVVLAALGWPALMLGAMDVWQRPSLVVGWHDGWLLLLKSVDPGGPPPQLDRFHLPFLRPPIPS